MDRGNLLIMNKPKNIFAVCDLEVEYACNFMEYLNQKRNIPFEVQAFTGPEVLCDYAREHPVEILLISGKAMCDAVKDLKVGMLIILSEGVHNPELDQYPSVYKYQSSDNVIREILDCYGSDKTLHPQTSILKKETKIIGIYSPVGRSQKTSFALTLGQILSKNRASLYLNMENFSGFQQIFHSDYEHTLSDLLYFLRQDHTNLIYKLSSMVQSLQNLDFIPPVISPMDIQCTSSEEWIKLFDLIAKESNYEFLILDIGDGVQNLFQILECCNRLYLPTRSDLISAAKITQFEHLLDVWGHPSLCQSIKKIKLPYHTANRTGQTYFEELVWSELGDFVKELLRKEDFL